MRTISPEAVRSALASGAELAFVDVREAGQHGEGHPLLAVNLPYSQLERLATRLIPARHPPVCILDAGDGVAERAAARLAAAGYADLRIVEGGAAGWAEAGFTLYRGVNVPSKVFGELVEHAFATPRITAPQLRAARAGNPRLVLLDGRTPGEFRKMSIPGARSCPNAELAYRLGALAPDPGATVVINCAGRTRSIIGAQTLRALGVPNPVLALENGTQGWALAGYELEHGRDPAPLPALDAAARERTRALAADLMARAGIPSIDAATLERWRGDPARTLYLLDVRTEEEFAAGHLPGARSAPGGQLVQATDQWVAVRGARIVLGDDTGLRAATTAYWLRGMGHDAVVLEPPPPAGRAAGPGPDLDPDPDDDADLGLHEARVPPLSELPPAELPRHLAAGAALVDLSPSSRFLHTHLEGARWGIRPRLDRLRLEAGRAVVLTADDPATAAMAALDVEAAGQRVLGYLTGDPARWAANALRTGTGDRPSDAERIDYLFFVHDRHDGNLDAARAYLAWETGLIEQLDPAERAVFSPLALEDPT